MRYSTLARAPLLVSWPLGCLKITVTPATEPLHEPIPPTIPFACTSTVSTHRTHIDQENAPATCPWLPRCSRIHHSTGSAQASMLGCPRVSLPSSLIHAEPRHRATARRRRPRSPANAVAADPCPPTLRPKPAIRTSTNWSAGLARALMFAQAPFLGSRPLRYPDNTRTTVVAVARSRTTPAVTIVDPRLLDPRSTTSPIRDCARAGIFDAHITPLNPLTDLCTSVFAELVASSWRTALFEPECVNTHHRLELLTAPRLSTFGADAVFPCRIEVHAAAAATSMRLRCNAGVSSPASSTQPSKACVVLLIIISLVFSSSKMYLNMY